MDENNEKRIRNEQEKVININIQIHIQNKKKNIKKICMLDLLENCSLV